MCTVTLIPVGGDAAAGGSGGDAARGWRLACNRDEQRTRKRGQPPRVMSIGGGRRAIMPIDPESDGTWIGVNDMGLAAVLLNANVETLDRRPAWRVRDGVAADEPRRSRGGIVPAILACDDLPHVEAWLDQFNPQLYPPFRLMACHGGQLLQAWSDGTCLATSNRAWDSPIMLTSSGLGDAVVEPPRRGLFRQMFDCPPARWPEAQDAFHRHRFAGQPHLSVNMSRADARTVSLTVIECDGTTAVMTYHGAAPDAPTAREHRVELALPRPVEAMR